MSHTRERRLAQLIALGASGVIAWWACAPMVGTMPSPAPLADAGPGTTVALSLGGLAEQDCRQDPNDRLEWICTRRWDGGRIFAGHLGYGGERRGPWEFGVFGGGGAGALGYVGGYGRYFVADGEDFQAGMQLQLGGLSAAFGFPAAVRLSPKLWLTTAPSVGHRMSHAVQVPVGLSWDIDDHLRLGAELTVGAVGGVPDMVFFGGPAQGDLGLWGSFGFTIH